MAWAAVVYDDTNVVAVSGPLGSEQEVDEWVVDTFPGYPTWDSIELFEPGKTIRLECGHTIVAPTLILDAARCPSCGVWQEVLRTKEE